MRADYLDAGLFPFQLRNLGLAPSSVYNYSKAVEQFLKTNPDIASSEDYNEFLVRVMARSNKRGTFYYYALKHYIKYKHENPQLRERLIKQLIKPENRDPKTSRQFLSKEKRVEVLNAMKSEKHRIVALIQMITGLRAGDILRLKLGCIQEEDYQGKPVLRIDVIGKRQRKTSSYILNEAARDEILSYIQPIENETGFEGFYFLDNKKLSHKPDAEYLRLKKAYLTYWLDLKGALNTVKVDLNTFSTHDWRRCFSRDNYEKFKDITVLQNVLGHQSIATTARYLRHSGLNNLDVLNKMQN